MNNDTPILIYKFTYEGRTVIEENYKNLIHLMELGSDDGYYKRLYISGWTRDIHSFDGEPENMNMFDHLNYSRESKYYYCLHCDKKICKT